MRLFATMQSPVASRIMSNLESVGTQDQCVSSNERFQTPTLSMKHGHSEFFDRK